MKKFVDTYERLRAFKKSKTANDSFRRFFWKGFFAAEEGDIPVDIMISQLSIEKADAFEAELRERAAECLRIARGELHELEASGAKRIVLRVRYGAHGGARGRQVAGHGNLLVHPVAQETPSFTAGRDSADSEAVPVLAAPFEVAILEYP